MLRMARLVLVGMSGLVSYSAWAVTPKIEAPVGVPAGPNGVVVQQHRTVALEPRIDAHDPQSLHWLLSDPSLLANVADDLVSFNAAEAVWLTLRAQTTLIPAAGEDQDVLFYHGDHLGSTSVMTDRQGALVQETAYFPFGEVRHSHEPDIAPRQLYGFTGKERDAESDLHYFEARYLTAPLSRFLSADPKFSNPGMLSTDDLSSCLSQPQKSNLYSYGLNNPLKYRDPTGLDTLEDAKLIADTTSNIDKAASAIEGVLNATGQGQFAPYVKAVGFKASAISIGSQAVAFAKDPTVEGGNSIVKDVAMGGLQVVGSTAALPLTAADFVLQTTYKNTPQIHDGANKAGARVEAATGAKALGALEAARFSVVTTVFKSTVMMAPGAQYNEGWVNDAIDWMGDHW